MWFPKKKKAGRKDKNEYKWMKYVRPKHMLTYSYKIFNLNNIKKRENINYILFLCFSGSLECLIFLDWFGSFTVFLRNRNTKWSFLFLIFNFIFYSLNSFLFVIFFLILSFLFQASSFFFSFVFRFLLIHFHIFDIYILFYFQTLFIRFVVFFVFWFSYFFFN